MFEIQWHLYNTNYFNAGERGPEGGRGMPGMPGGSGGPGKPGPPGGKKSELLRMFATNILNLKNTITLSIANYDIFSYRSWKTRRSRKKWAAGTFLSFDKCLSRFAAYSW